LEAFLSSQSGIHSGLKDVVVGIVAVAGIKKEIDGGIKVAARAMFQI